MESIEKTYYNKTYKITVCFRKGYRNMISKKINLLEVMDCNMITLDENTDIEEALVIFARKMNSVIAIVDKEKSFKGVITESDVISRLAKKGSVSGAVSEYINHDKFIVIDVDEINEYDGDIEEELLCICDSGKIAGIVEKDQWINYFRWENDLLRQFESRCNEYELIFRNYYDSIYDINYDGRVIFASSATYKIIGKTPEEVIGKNIREIEKEKMYFPSVAAAVRKSNKTVTIIQNIEKDRKAVVTGVPVLDERGRLMRVIAATREIDSLVESLENSTLAQDMAELKERLNNKEQLAETYFSELRKLRDESNEAKKINTHNKEMRAILDMIRKIAPTDSNILILGESGTGKDLIANMIHNMSNRSKGPFVKINCGAIPENILESELFGYEPGAFTGAQKNGKAGLLEIANGGTVFLNEIGEMPVNLQVKLLQAIQDRKFIRVGGYTEKEVDIRIISATNKNLEEAIRTGEFREDLYYRLNVVPINLPALRNRKEDIPELCFDFLKVFNEKYLRDKKLSSEAMRILLNYTWPGNVRELENLIERLVVVSEEDTIYPSDFPENMQIYKKKAENPNIVFEEGRTLREMLDTVERSILKQAYEKYGNTVKLADLLDVNQSTIARKLKKYDIYSEVKKR